MAVKMAKRQGLLVIVSGPSGVGKGTVLQLFLSERQDCVRSVSATTRSPREGEVDGVSYHFLDGETFERWVAEDRFLEWDEHFGNKYGTLKDVVARERAAGRHVILEIDVMGAQHIKQQVPDAVGIFIAPPSISVLHERLRLRGTESEEQLQDRFARVRRELECIPTYDYMVINDELPVAVGQLHAIFDAELLRTERWRSDGALEELFEERDVSVAP